MYKKNGTVNCKVLMVVIIKRNISDNVHSKVIERRIMQFRRKDDYETKGKPK